MWGRWEIQTVDLYVCLESLPCWRTGSAASTSFVRVLRLCRGWNRLWIFSTMNRLSQTVPAERRLIFFLRFFFLLSLLFHGKAASPGDLVAPKASSRARGRRLGQVCWERASGTQPRVTNPVLPTASPAGTESNFLTRLKCFFQPPLAEPVR